jgi:hypothetical protein
MECSRIKTDGNKCSQIAFVKGLCLFHDALDQTKKRKRLAKEAWAQILDALWTFQDEGVVQTILSETLPRLKPKEAVTFRWKVYAELFRYKQDTDRLCVFADNEHNAHTLPIITQTEHTLTLLRTLDRPFDRNVPSDIMDAWMMHDTIPGDRMVGVGQEMFQAYAHDLEYAELLDLLWVYIQGSPHKDELVLRLYQEIKESRKKCHSGKMARLCNVLVGFDERFNPPVAPGQIVQYKMLAISQKPISVEHKVGEAWKVFEEFKTPMEEREAWIREF